MLNVLQINNFHFLHGGSETVYLETAETLKKHGNKVIFFSMQHPQNLPSETSNFFMPYVDFNSEVYNFLSKIKIAGRILYSFEAKKRLSNILNKYSIDIAHLHNIYLRLSPSIIDKLKSRGIPIIMTLHDFRSVCFSCSLFLRGEPCEACSSGRYYKAFKTVCVRNSFPKTCLNIVEMYLHHKILKIYDNVDLFISPSIFLKNKLKEMGFKKEIIYLPNFIDMKRICQNEDKVGSPKNTLNNSVVYYGRLSSEKGLWTLLEAAKRLKLINKQLEIKIIGSGSIEIDLKAKVKTEDITNVKFLGYMNGEELFENIKTSLAVVLPSECYENCPMSILEAFALGKPVIGSRLGGIPELVRDGVTGYLFEAKNADDLTSKIALCLKDKESTYKLGSNAREFVKKKFNSEVYYKNLISLYEKVLEKQ